VLNCSDTYASKIDDAVRRIMEECYANAKKLILDNLDILDAVAAFLLEKETITGEEFMEIFHRVIAERKSEDGASEAASEVLLTEANVTASAEKETEAVTSDSDSKIVEETTSEADSVQSEEVTEITLD
jgi:cell division protease FtsH